ncbi:prenylcysteine oxidase/farnesylcysteine lyase [Fusarium austroafricanum]|uniref:Prenylcysteine oxidase/farnesylcysteine lyase n=1 Tax=Fusarium austroafricanum TaxID=2364996 RepID=A0A8H4KHG0_9HYPO|nr:prenylcysteine oxidase/farnesylcysteine lyase [Fusarium austroafricanum]
MNLAAALHLALLGALVGVPCRAEIVHNVAIIGAGAAGSSAAFHLRKYALEEDLTINITVFEKTDRIGGRTLTVPAYGDYSLPIELGASIFVGANHILVNASERFNLPLSEPHRLEKNDMTVIWDGINFVFQTTEGSWGWWDLAKMFWRYGLSPYRTKQIVDAMIEEFLKLYEAPYFPFKSLSKRAEQTGFTEITGMTGAQLLNESEINPRFAREILQVGTRVNYASNLAYIHGLETLVSLATDNAMSVETGNWRIFEHMILDSDAAIYRNTTVAGIEKLQKKAQPSSPKYVITTKDASSKGNTAEPYGVEFDNVIIASPWQFSNIKAGEGVLDREIDEIPYTKLHVTLFASALELSPEFFGLKPGSKAPATVYTTLGEDEEPKQGPEGVGRTGFFSISTLKYVINPNTGQKERVYKIFSPKPITAEFLSSLLGTKIPDSVISGKGQDDANTSKPITWYHPQLFHSYPIELPRVTFEGPVIGEGVYYTSGIESFISCMEASALMGKNVARLAVDAFASISRPEPTPEYVAVGEELEDFRVQAEGEL